MGLDKPYIIAEIGSNWLTLEHCYLQIKAAKRAGANAAKFQLYSHEELYGYKGKIAGALNRQWLEPLATYCDRIQIDFLCSVFSWGGVGIVNRFVKMHKIASCESSYSILVDAARSTGKLVMVSMGCQTSYRSYQSGIIPMECVAAYPASSNDYAFSYLLGTLFGLSDHTMDNLVATVAVGAGAMFFEKHFDAIGFKNTPDAKHSINEKDFLGYADAINLAFKIMTQPKDIRASEKDVAKYYKRRPTKYGFYRTKPRSRRKK